MRVAEKIFEVVIDGSVGDEIHCVRESGSDSTEFLIVKESRLVLSLKRHELETIGRDLCGLVERFDFWPVVSPDLYWVASMIFGKNADAFSLVIKKTAPDEITLTDMVDFYFRKAKVRDWCRSFKEFFRDEYGVKLVENNRKRVRVR